MLSKLVRWLLRSDVSARREAFALAAGCAGVVLGLLYAFVRLDDSSRTYFLYYNLPIAAPFAAFLLERAAGPVRAGTLVTDLAVVGASLARVVFPVPGYSGHVLFLVYSTLSARGAVLRLLSAAVLLEVVIIKLAWWGDFLTLAGGVAIGVIAAVLARRCADERPPRKQRRAAAS